MNTILFTFREGTGDDRRDGILEQLRQAVGIKAAGQVRPNASLPRLRRLAYAEAAGEDAITQASRLLKNLPEIESVELPPARGIAA
ncbi:hypothetical protein M0638_17510 [Roseomonas sp. NAR14]|uniref:Uncharacterized protein n=1 Tax=Roseomonas acroporae TaxID=2937791 RepID=A0A9X2BWL6_9PROT|nr:hypothetical protein [Roseomonas acroporae]MCK8786176.1 hypothetical protein [Roseomonas acroporae]